MTTNRQTILNDIARHIQTHQITWDEIQAAINSMGTPPAITPSEGTAFRLFALLGALFIFSGMVALVALLWDNMGSFARVMTLLLPGIAAMAGAIIMYRQGLERWYAAPMLCLAAVLQPSGVFVALDEFFGQGNSRLAVFIIFLLMAVQQVGLYRWMRQSILLFFALLFGVAAFFVAADLVGMGSNITSIIAGASLVALCSGLRQQGHQRLCSLYFAAGGAMLLHGSFELVEGTMFELAYFAINLALLYVSTAVSSRSLLAVSTLGILSYIGYFTAKHFVDSLGWPLVLILLGIVFTAIGMFAMKLRSKLQIHSA